MVSVGNAEPLLPLVLLAKLDPLDMPLPNELPRLSLAEVELSTVKSGPVSLWVPAPWAR